MAREDQFPMANDFRATQEHYGALWDHQALSDEDRFLQVGCDAHMKGVNTATLLSDRTDFEKVATCLPANRFLRLTLAVDHASLGATDDGQICHFTGLSLQSDIVGPKGVQGCIELLRVF